MKRLWNSIKKRRKAVEETIDQYQCTLTFAEAGQNDDSLESGQTERPTETARKLVVIGRDSSFSRHVVDYAIEMAKRLRYEIVALNTAPVPDGIFDRFSSAQKELRKGFRTLSEENAEMFRNEAQEQGLAFSHAVKFCDQDVALNEISKQFGDVEFVISDTEEEQAVARPEAAERPEQSIYVYSVL